MSNVFHSCPQVQDQRSCLRGDQPQSGHRMRGPDGSRLFSSSSSRSKTTDWSGERAHTPRYYDPVRMHGVVEHCREGLPNKRGKNQLSQPGQDIRQFSGTRDVRAVSARKFNRINPQLLPHLLAPEVCAERSVFTAQDVGCCHIRPAS